MAGHTAVTLKVIETEAPKNDMITVDLKTQDTQLDPKRMQWLRRLLKLKLQRMT